MGDKEHMEERVKKSSMTANNIYDYNRIMYPNPHFVETGIEEDGEELLLSYDLTGRTELSKIREEDMEVRLTILMNVAALSECKQSFAFSMAPDNLYYDRNHLVYVRRRDIYAEGMEYDEEVWLKEYKSLAGYALQKQLSYQDYLEGGTQLLKGGLLAKIRQAASTEELTTLLGKKCDEIMTERKRDKILLNRRKYKRLRILCILFLTLCLIGGAGIIYDRVKAEPYQQAVMAAEEAYIANDYVACMDAMENVAVKDMNTCQKYILANSYVRSENLTQEQKDNILGNLSMKDTTARLEYWIYLGRGDTTEAVDIALQQSDDELLLYAYMKQKADIEADTTLSGAEKTSQLEEVAKNMQPLMDKYDTEEK